MLLLCTLSSCDIGADCSSADAQEYPDDRAETSSESASHATTDTNEQDRPATVDTGKQTSNDESPVEKSRSDGKSATADSPFDRLWAGDVNHGRVRIDLGYGDPFPDHDVPFEPHDRYKVAAYSAETIRPPFRGVSEIDVLTPDGPVRVAFTGVRRDPRGPDADIGYELMTERSEHLEDISPMVAILAPSGEMAKSATYRAAETAEPDPRVAARLEKAVLIELPPAARAVVEKGSLEKIGEKWREKLKYAESSTYQSEPGLEANHFGTVEGEFAEPYTHFVVANGRKGVDAVGIEFNLVRASLFADATAERLDVVRVVHGPEYKWGHAAITRAEPLALVDLDGDGIEGVLYELDDSVRLADFDEGRVVERVLK